MVKKNMIIIVTVIAIVSAIIVYPMISQQLKYKKVNVQPSETNLKEVACDVSVFNPRGLPLVRNGDLVIESATCQQQYVANCGRFGLFSDVGTLRLEAEGGLGSSEDVKVSEGSSQSYSLTWCGSKLTSVFKLKLLNDNNEQIQLKEVKLQ